MSNIVIHSDKDLVLLRWDEKILKKQGSKLLELLPKNWIYHEFDTFQKFLPNCSSSSIYSPIFENTLDLSETIDVVTKAISGFIACLNKSGNTISRISCYIEQSNDKDALPHPLNNNKESIAKYSSNQDYKNCKWIFDDTNTVCSVSDQTVYGNQFKREYNNKVKINKKYYIIKIESSWGSL
jgi:hypothetical protein